jgi:hypothetical protein
MRIYQQKITGILQKGKTKKNKHKKTKTKTKQPTQYNTKKYKMQIYF